MDADGTVTAVSSGTASVVATTRDGGYTLVCTVTVRIGESGGGSEPSQPSGPSEPSGPADPGAGVPGSGTDPSQGGSGDTAYAGCGKDASCPVSAFGDAWAGAWYHDGVHWCVANGVMRGYDDGSGLFGVNDSITRAQVATVLWRMAGSPASSFEPGYSDADASAWYAPALRWAAEAGVATGYGDGSSFGPGDPVTREQLAVMLKRFAACQGRDASDVQNSLAGYSDAGDVSPWALEGVRWANRWEVVRGTDNGTLMPQGTATRAEAACMLQRYAVNLAK